MIRCEDAQDRRFRTKVREWLDDSLPAHLRHLTFRPQPAEIMPWHEALAAQGWIAPHWPVAAGGMGASPVEQIILFEEFSRAGAPDIPAQGLNHIGPLFIKEGNAAQKAEHLPRILSGERVWCQGYSEPQAGSDLAGLSTRARIDGDELVIDGHKIWTTWGHHAHWMFALVRTGGRRRDGITFVLIDLATPGITRRPIRTIAGDDEFCEVFFDAVRVPLSNVVGKIGEGWRVATSLLDEERMHLGTPLLANRALVRLQRLVGRMDENGRKHWQPRLREAEFGVETVTAAWLDTMDRFEAGVGVENESSFLKILATETVQQILDMAQEAAGHLAAHAQAVIEDGQRFDVNEMFLQSRRLTIYGGSNEIQRTILATRILGMGNG
jgi:alkylation response protein AidB-like acyl-CoA dehydrogenase